MTRIKFLRKNQQRRFLNDVMEKLNCPSLGELSRRIDLDYSSLKNYYSEKRLLPKELFENLCYISGLDKNGLDYKELNDNWGKSLGGKRGKKELGMVTTC